MDNRDLMQILSFLPKEVQLAHIKSMIEDSCIDVLDTPQFKQWYRAVIKLDMYQNALIDVLEDAVEYIPEHYEPEDTGRDGWRIERMGGS